MIDSGIVGRIGAAAGIEVERVRGREETAGARLGGSAPPTGWFASSGEHRSGRGVNPRLVDKSLCTGATLRGWLRHRSGSRVSVNMAGFAGVAGAGCSAATLIGLRSVCRLTAG